MDASIGLTFSLQLFQRYRRSGSLQATIRHIPGIQGACTAYVSLNTGSVTTCYLETKHGQHLPFSLQELRHLDDERGPFEWTFQRDLPAPHARIPGASMTRPFLAAPPSRSGIDALVPRAVAPLRWERFRDWPREQKLLLQDIWKSIDGKHTVHDVKISLPYPPESVNDVLQILLTLRIIVLTPLNNGRFSS